ncbi:hypothetical protein SEVIR_5G413450v4 [Setaria viridis]
MRSKQRFPPPLGIAGSQRHRAANSWPRTIALRSPDGDRTPADHSPAARAPGDRLSRETLQIWDDGSHTRHPSFQDHILFHICRGARGGGAPELCRARAAASRTQGRREDRKVTLLLLLPLYTINFAL